MPKTKAAMLQEMAKTKALVRENAVGKVYKRAREAKPTKKATTNKQRNNKNDYTVESLMEQILNNKNTTKKQTNNKKDEQQIANIMEQILFSL